MRAIESIPKKIQTLTTLKATVASWRATGKTVAFTNGCFDILHEGHIFSLSQAAKEADFLIVAVNSDASIQRLKGYDRPINKEQSRALIIASLAIVDAVIAQMIELNAPPAVLGFLARVEAFAVPQTFNFVMIVQTLLRVLLVVMVVFSI